jgi:hypothetical protein
VNHLLSKNKTRTRITALFYAAVSYAAGTDLGNTKFKVTCIILNLKGMKDKDVEALNEMPRKLFCFTDTERRKALSVYGDQTMSNSFTKALASHCLSDSQVCP